MWGRNWTSNLSPYHFWPQVGEVNLLDYGDKNHIFLWLDCNYDRVTGILRDSLAFLAKNIGRFHLASCRLWFCALYHCHLYGLYSEILGCFHRNTGNDYHSERILLRAIRENISSICLAVFLHRRNQNEDSDHNAPLRSCSYDRELDSRVDSRDCGAKNRIGVLLFFVLLNQSLECLAHLYDLSQGVVQWFRRSKHICYHRPLIFVAGHLSDSDSHASDLTVREFQDHLSSFVVFVYGFALYTFGFLGARDPLPFLGNLDRWHKVAAFVLSLFAGVRESFALHLSLLYEYVRTLVNGISGYLLAQDRHSEHCYRLGSVQGIWCVSHSFSAPLPYCMPEIA